MRRKTLPTALLLVVALATASACGGHSGGDSKAPPATTSDPLAAAIGEAVAQKAADFDARPPGGGPRTGVTAGTGVGVSGEAVSNPQSPAAAAVEAEFLTLTNNARAAVGINGLGVEPGLAGYARGVATDIAAAGVLTHSHIEDLLGAWWAAGENIGFGPDAAAIQGAFEHSPGHYENMVNPIYGAVGIGVFIDGANRVWVALDFAG